MKRTPTPFKPDPNLDAVAANDIEPNAIESAHLAPSEVMEVIELEFDGSFGTGQTVVFTVPAGITYKIVDAISISDAVVAGGEVDVKRNGANAILTAGALAMAAGSGAIVRAADIATAEKILSPGDTLTVELGDGGEVGTYVISVIKQ